MRSATFFKQAGSILIGGGAMMAILDLIDTRGLLVHGIVVLAVGAALVIWAREKEKGEGTGGKDR